MQNQPTLNDVSDTALWVAVYRGLEGRRPDALFQDPLAERLYGERGVQIANRMSFSRYTAWSVVIRTCIIDSYIKTLVASGVDTIINLGCGLDTRPYRLDLPVSLRWIEVDYPHMVEMKNEKLGDQRPRCQLERVGMDLADQKLRKEFFERIGKTTQNAMILTEGVTIYLTNDQVAALAKDLREVKSFRHWVVEYVSPLLVEYLHAPRRQAEMRNAPFRFAPGDWFQFFSQLGWTAREVRYISEESKRLGRRIPAPWWSYLLAVITPPKKREAYRKMSAYVILEPQ